MKILDVPTNSLMDVRRSPAKVFERARLIGNPIYIFNRGVPEGVIMTKEQYELLNDSFEKMQELEFDNQVVARIDNNNEKTFSDKQVRGDIASQTFPIDEYDGWE